MNEVLVIPRFDAGQLPDEGTWPVEASDWPREWQWMERALAESDENHLQVIPYAAVLNEKGHLWCYRRLGGDQRLADRLSCGIGGHVDRGDLKETLQETLLAGLQREIAEEIGWTMPPSDSSGPVAWIYEHHSAVGRVHLGLLYLLNWEQAGPPRPRFGEPLEGLGFRDPAEIVADEGFELWSRLAARFLIASQAKT